MPHMRKVMYMVRVNYLLFFVQIGVEDRPGIFFLVISYTNFEMETNYLLIT